MDSLPSASIVVLNWNGRPWLDACLASLSACDYPDFSIVVVDNASSDDSVTFVQQHFPQIQLHCNEHNLGFAAGNNVALCRVQSEIAVLVNPDVVVDQDWLRHLVAPLAADDAIGIAGSKIYYPGRRRLQHAGGFIRPPQAMPGYYGHDELAQGQYQEMRDVGYVVGAALAIKRGVWQEIGLLDEGFFLYYEDVDWCTRARRAGYRVVYVPEATLVHHESVLTEKWSADYLRHFHSGRWRYLLKHYSPDTILDETMPAEQAWLPGCDPVQRMAAAGAFRATLRQLAAIWQARHEHGGTPCSPEQQKEIAGSLRQLVQAARQLQAAHGLESLRNSALVEERLFVSAFPVLGPLIARARAAWNNVATRWYVRPLLQQQNEFNQVVVGQMADHLAHLQHLQSTTEAQQETIEHLATQLADLQRQLADLQRQIETLEERLEE